MGSLPKLAKKFWEHGSGRTALAAFCAHSVSISIGITQGYSAILNPQLNSSKTLEITADEISWLASLGAATNPAGSILSGVFAEYLGRQRSIQISSIPFLIGWLCIGLANHMSLRRDDIIKLLYAGRLITGIAGGMSTASYTYVSEISSPERRGTLQALGPICASFGIFLTYILGYFLHWATIAFLSITFCIFSLVVMQFLPESPAYLVQKGDVKRSFDIYLWFRRNVSLAQQEMLKHSTQDKMVEKRTTKEAYFSAVTLKPFAILVILFFLQEMSGIYTILFYAVDFFKETKLNIDEYISTIIMGSLRFVMSVVAAFLVNRFGRKILCITSSAGMSAAMLAMVVYFKYYEDHPDEDHVFSVLPLICVVLNVMFSMLGMLPIPWIMVGEMFSLQVRPIMCGLVICIAQALIFLVVRIYYNMLDSIKFSGTLSTFLAAALVAVAYCKFILPETKNKSLQEIEAYFRGERKENADVEGYDNRGFVITPEILSGKSDDMFTVQVH